MNKGFLLENDFFRTTFQMSHELISHKPLTVRLYCGLHTMHIVESKQINGEYQ